MRKIIFLLLLVCFARPLFAQLNSFWEPFPGPYGGSFRTLTLTQGDTLYAHAYIGVDGFSQGPVRLFRSTNGGQSWERLNLMLNGSVANAYVNVGPTGNFNLVRNEGSSNSTKLYRSFDGGLTWTLYTLNKLFITVYETENNALVGVTSGHDIYRSQNGGQTWTVAGSTISNPSKSVEFLRLQNGDLTCRGFFESEIYRSTDNGISWEIITVDSSTDLTIGQVYAASNGTLILLGQGLVQRSIDNGISWQKIYTSSHGDGGMVELSDGSLLMANENYNLYKSTDNGQTWNGILSNHRITKILPFRLSDGTIFGICNALYRSSDGGVTWQFAADSMDLAIVLKLDFTSEDTMFAMTENGLYRSFEHGQTWTKISDLNQKYSVLEGYSVSLRRHFALGEHGHLVTCTDNKLLWSDNFGDSWQNRTPAAGIFTEAVAMGNHDSLLFINANTNPTKVMRSLDQGQSWQSTNFQNAAFTRMEFHPGGRIFALVRFSNQFEVNLWYSDDQGMNWTLCPGLNTTTNITIDAAGTIWASGDGYIYRSLDQGNTWSKGPAQPTNLYGSYLSSNLIGHLFANNQYRSVDAGLSWPELPTSGYYNDYIIVDPISPNQHLFSNFRYVGFARTRNPTVEGAYLNGTLRRDADDDCSTADAQNPLKNWVVQAQGTYNSWANSDSSGQYLMFLDTGTYEVRVKTINDLWWSVCDSIQLVTLDSSLQTQTVDFDVISTAPCPLMTVNLTIPGMRRCFDNTIWVNYCNEGGEIAENAYVDVSLDKFTDFVSAEIPGLDLGNNTYRFPIGNLASNDCGQFKLVVHLQCGTTILGQTHCFNAHAFPDTLCTPVPNWSGAQIQASVQCEDTIVKFKLKNIGTAISEQLDYIIIIDDVVMMQDSKFYIPGEELVISQPANGFTWRIESMQEPGQPFATSNHITLAFEEGCGGFNSLGYINKFPVDEYAPSWDRDCIENTGSYDPNDKQGFPKGIGDIHQIVPNQELKYLIRFQNTGTDTAFTVVVRDTLSPWLNPASIHGVIGSHPFTWNLSGNGILTFTFNNIMLPDSNKTSEGSQGFVSFRINQQAEVPIGAQIFNQAAIFFDFNEPVITNQTMHTIGLPPVLATRPVLNQKPSSSVLITPQPAQDFTHLSRKDGLPFHNARFVLLDAQGQQRMEQRLHEAQFRLERGTCPAGIYFFRIENAEGMLESSGSIIWQ